MPPTYSDEGLVAAIALRRRWPGLAVIVLSQYVQPTYATELLEVPSEAGVGYLLKERIGDVAEFASAVSTVAAGGTVLPGRGAADGVGQARPAVAVEPA